MQTSGLISLRCPDDRFSSCSTNSSEMGPLGLIFMRLLPHLNGVISMRNYMVSAQEFFQKSYHNLIPDVLEICGKSPVHKW